MRKKILVTKSMKMRLIAWGLVGIIGLFFVGCDIATAQTEEAATAQTEETNTSCLFTTVETEGIWTIVYHRDTKVMYAVCYTGYKGGASVTVLYNPDGTPMVYSEE
jgi:hypothetical protein